MQSLSEHNRPPKTNLLTAVRNRRKLQKSVPRGIPYSGPLGPTFTGKFRYVDAIDITSGVACGVYSFRTSSMFDPDFSGTGHQPQYRDLFSPLYARYCILSMDYKITPLTTNTDQYMAGLLFTQDSGFNPASRTFPDNLEKRPSSLWNFIPVNCQPRIFQGRVDNWDIAAVDRKTYIEERQYSAAVGTNPALELYMTIYQQHADLSTTITHKYMVELEFEVHYFEPVIQAFQD